MNEGPRYTSFGDYLRVVRERRLLIAAITLLFVVAAVAYSIRQDPVYQAEASLEILDQNVDTSLVNRPLNTGGQTPEARAAIAAQTATRREVAERASRILPGRQDVDALQSRVSARPEARTQLVVMQASGPTAREAAAVTNAFAEGFQDVERRKMRELYRNAARSQRRVLRELADEPGSEVSRVLLRQDIAKLEELADIAEPVAIRRAASTPGAPVSPKPVRTTLLGLLLGLTVAIIAAFARDSLDRRFKSSHEITDELHMPLLGFVREQALGRGLVAGKGREAMTQEDLEAFRILRTNIEFLDVDAPPKTIVVTSALPQEGKSTIACALAAAYAMAGKRTLLVEGDLRRPTLAPRLGMNETPGLTDYLVGNATPAEVLQTIALPSMAGNGRGPASSPEPAPLVVITAGSPAPQPAELLRSQRCRDLFAQVRDVYDIVVVDSCPLLSVVDTLELVPISDAVVVCVRASQTTRDQARAASGALAHFPRRSNGVVVTGLRSNDEAAGYGYYSYGYVYGGERG